MLFNKFRVITSTRNMQDGETTFKEEKDTKKEAMDLFFKNCDSYGTNPQTKTCEVIVIDNNGDIIELRKIDNSEYIAE